MPHKVIEKGRAKLKRLQLSQDGHDHMQHLKKKAVLRDSLLSVGKIIL
jgi:hypothetical protein